MKVLVTGDRGYIGTVLVRLFLDKGYEVVGYDTSYFAKHARNKKNYTIVTKDIRNIQKSDLVGIDYIVHLCALSNDPMGELNPKLTEEINYKATMRLAKFCKESGIKKFIFSSSCSIYGITKEDIVDEFSEVNPLTEYAKSKLLVEKGLKKIADKNFCVGIMRNATVYGYSPRFRDDLVVNNLVTCALSLGKIKVLSDGSPWRPLIDIRDLSRAFVYFLEAPEAKINGEIINVGFNESNYRVKDIVSIIKSKLADCTIEYTKKHGSDSRSYKVNFDKLHRLFPNFKQEWTLERSIVDLIRHLKAKNYCREDFLSGKYTRLAELKKLMESGKINSTLYYSQT